MLSLREMLGVAVVICGILGQTLGAMETTTAKDVAANMAGMQNSETFYKGFSPYEEPTVFKQDLSEELDNDVNKLLERDAGKEGVPLEPEVDLPPELLELYARFAHLIPQLAAAHQSSVNQVDYCNPQRPDEGRKYYCRGLNNGFYYDPWNPWCGYIECLNDQTYRFRCRNHTFVDIMASPQMSQKSMCRKSLEKIIPWRGQCPQWNEGDICVKAGTVEYGNPPYPSATDIGGITATQAIPTTTSQPSSPSAP